MRLATKAGGMLTLLTAAVTAAACGSSGPGAPAGAASAWALVGHETAFQSSFDAWNEANPDQHVAVEFFANDAYKQKIRTAIGAGDSPTLIWSWGGGTLRSYADTGRIVPLDPALVSDVLPSIAQNGEIDGELFAVPNNAVQPVMLFYNKEVLESAGITEPPATWDELLEQVQILRANGIAPFSMGGASKWPQLMWLSYLTDRIGGPEVFEAVQNGEPGAWSHPAIIQALTMIQELVEAGGFADGFQSMPTDNSADLALLYTGRAAMLVQGSWVYPEFKRQAADLVASGNLGWAPFPDVDGGAGDSSAVVGNASNYWSVSADATQAQQDAAKAYLAEGNFSDEFVTNMIAGGGVPPLVDLEDEIAISEDAEFLSDAYAMTKDASSFTLSWDQAIDPGQADAMLTNLDRIFLRQITPQQFADAMNRTMGH